MMYFNYYTDEDGSYSLSNRIQKAYSFFELNYQNENISPDFKSKNMSDCYYQICYFYKKYILSSATVEEASKSDYENLFTTINDTLEKVREESPYDQLSLYNTVFMLMYDQRSNMMQVNVEQESILQMVDNVYSEAKGLAVKKEQSQKLQNEIVRNYDSYREAIIRAYSNAEER